jgi:ABC-type nitrate/sulfonate/bicarbonate transport system substrate-binding protein
MLAAGLALPGLARAQATKKATIVLSTSDQDVSYQPYGPYAAQQGWFREAGLDIGIETAPTTGQVIQLVLSGRAQMGQITPDALLLAAQSQPVPIRLFYVIARKQIWGAIVRPDSPLQRFGDFKGKTIGFPANSPAMVAFVDTRMKEEGTAMAEAKEVATGYGVASMEALRNGTIDTFIAWPGLFAAYENAGYAFRRIPDAPWQTGYYGIGLGATDEFIRANPELITQIGRGLARTAVVLKAKPELLVQSFWRSYPTRGPLPGTNRADALKKELNILKATAEQMRIDDLPADFTWGIMEPEVWQRHVKNLLETRLLNKPLDPTLHYTNQFNAAYQQFDRTKDVRG